MRLLYAKKRYLSKGVDEGAELAYKWRNVKRINMAQETKLGRPSTVKEGEKLNLYLPKEAKRILFRMATKHRKSMSAVVTDFLFDAEKKSA